MPNRAIIQQLQSLFSQRKDLREAMIMRIEANATANPDLRTNPVRSLNDLYRWFERMLTAMPWMGMEEQGVRSREQGLFYRIDQTIGYAYYIFGNLQYEPPIAEWLKQYNAAWAEYLNSTDSWNNDYYQLAKADPLFELDTDKYESPDHWHTWNEFFSRRLGILSSPPAFVAEGQTFPWLPIRNNILDIKTNKIERITDLLGESPYKSHFENGCFTHISLDVHNYHRFHSPVDGKVLDIQNIDGYLTDGGKIIWDKEKRKYRYEQPDNIGFQMIEKRVAIVVEIEAPDALENLESLGAPNLLAIVPVGVAQVGSVCLNDEINVGGHIRQGQELGCFLFGGSDIAVMKVENKELEVECK